jgi:hypothetical protein
MNHAVKMRGWSRGSWALTVVVVVATAAPPFSACDSPSTRYVAFPQVTTQDGAILAPLHLVTLVAANDSVDSTALFGFSSDVVTSRWWSRIAPDYGLNTVTDTAHLVGPPITADVTDHDVFDYITNAVDANGGLARDGHTLYLLYLPSGINVVQAGVPNTNCRYFGGYHARYGSRGDNLAVIQRCTETDPIENMTVIASHEILEAATDPDGRGFALPGIAARAPWNDAIWNAFDLRGDAELGDLCEGTFWVEGQSVYQRIWSNARARGDGDPCIPELSEPFYDTSFTQDWYPVRAGETVRIPVTGWATGAIDPWALTAAVQSGTTGFAATFGGPAMKTITSGQIVDLMVTAPASATPGAFAFISAWSHRPAAGLNAKPLTDGAHGNYVGVYVP